MFMWVSVCVCVCRVWRVCRVCEHVCLCVVLIVVARVMIFKSMSAHSCREAEYLHLGKVPVLDAMVMTTMMAYFIHSAHGVVLLP